MAPSESGERAVNWRLISLVIAFVVLGVLVAWMWRGAATQPDLDEGRAVAEKFLELTRTGKPAQAWQSTTAEFKSAEGRESFLKYVEDNPVLGKPLSFVSVQTVMLQDSPRAEYVYRSDDDNTTTTRRSGCWLATSSVPGASTD